MSLLSEGDNLIVEGVVEHSIYPTHHEEVAQTVILRGQYTVLGGIYGRVLKTSGVGTVHGPVVTREDLFLDQRDSVGQDTFLSGLTVPGTIRNETRLRVRSSCVTDLKEARLRVRGPIFADTVHLTNALIVGNIHARRITLEACVVFGVIECDELLVMNSCNFGAYRAGRAKLMGRLSTWLGYGISNDVTDFLRDPQARHFEPGTDADGEIPADIRYLPICLSGQACDRKDFFEACEQYHTGTCPACVSGNGPMPIVSLLGMDFHIRVGLREVRGDQSRQPVPVEIRYRKDDRQVQETVDISDVPQIMSNVTEMATVTMRTGNDAWTPFHEHPAFREHCLLHRVMSVAGRLLDGRALEKSLEDISALARSIAYYPYLDPASRDEVDTTYRPKLQGTLQLFDIGTTRADIRQAS